jgi:hypothetical protein
MKLSMHRVIGNPPSGRGWKAFFALAVVGAATALGASAQTLTTIHNFNGSPDGETLYMSPWHRLAMATCSAPPIPAVPAVPVARTAAAPPSESPHREL